MRASTAFGGFLLIGGLITVLLEPVYVAGIILPADGGVEATGPVKDIRPVPQWTALLSIGVGALLLGFSWRTRQQ